MTDRSLEGLMDFLEYLAKKGLMPRNTVSGRKAAAAKVLGVLDPEEASDVTSLDLESVMTRFYNLEGKGYKPESLNVYKSRVNSALLDFSAYLRDPASFKPSNATKKKAENGKKLAPKPKAFGSSGSVDLHTPRPEGATHITPVNVFPIPIRPDVVVRIQNLPFDLTAAEAEKIANVVKAMAMK